MDAHVAQDQSETFAFLADPATYGLSEPVMRIDTHGAAVFLAGDNVYKVKRAVRFPYMDFSTLEKRRAACEAENSVNRDNAPDLYLGVVAITRSGGHLRLGGEGEAVEWAVHLRRFDENATLDHIAKKGPLGHDLVDKLAKAVADAHRRAPVRDGSAAATALRNALNETLDELDEAKEFFSSEQAACFHAALVAAFNRAEPLLLRRGARRQARRCHGDLHLRNLVLINGNPVLFDAIEFDESIATSDILYDLAFLLMDLCERDLRNDANRLLNRYLWSCEDERGQIEGLAALPLFMALRAAIRAKVAVALCRLGPGKSELRDQAHVYFEAAVQYLEPAPARLIAIGGLSGTGKTTLAAALAPCVGRAPGAVHLRSDIERKRWFEVAETERLQASAYGQDVSDQIYGELRDLARIALHGGHSAIVDATYRRSSERDALARLAAGADVPFIGVWLDAPVDLLKRRVGERRDDASDATPDAVVAQSEEDIGALTWLRLDADRDVEQLKAIVLGVCKTCEQRGDSDGERG